MTFRQLTAILVAWLLLSFVMVGWLGFPGQVIATLPFVWATKGCIVMEDDETYIITRD